MKQGFLQTQKTVNKWITDFKKRIDGEDEEDHPAEGSEHRRQDYGPSQSAQMYGIQKSAQGRVSGDRERYDPDAGVVSDDFTALELRDDEGLLLYPSQAAVLSLTYCSSSRKAS